MNNLLLAVIFLLVYILLWFTINIVAYFTSVFLETKKIFRAFGKLAYTVAYIFNFLVGIGLIWFGISLLLSGHFLWFIVYLFIGAGIIGFLINLLQFPFIYITVYLSEKIEEKNFNEDIASAEIIDKDGKILKKVEGDTTISVRMAKYFTLLFTVNLLSVFIYPEARAGWRWGDYFLSPFLWIVSESFVVGIIYVLYHKIRYNLFFPEDKRYFFIHVWRICFLALLPITLFLFLVL